MAKKVSPPDAQTGVSSSLRLLKRVEAASQLGVSVRTLDRWGVIKVGPPRIKVGRYVFYRTETILKWLSSFDSSPGGTQVKGHE